MNVGGVLTLVGNASAASDEGLLAGSVGAQRAALVLVRLFACSFV
jgi:hypothetical protein